jgi:excisionase family DNA binding protein
MHTRLDRKATSLSTKLLFSIDEAATMLSLGRTAVYDAVMRQEIVSVKVGRTHRVPRHALHAFVCNLAMQQEGDKRDEATRQSGGQHP